eukprot:2771526-Pyramimonas_sp.AAC.2
MPARATTLRCHLFTQECLLLYYGKRLKGVSYLSIRQGCLLLYYGKRLKGGVLELAILRTDHLEKQFVRYLVHIEPDGVGGVDVWVKQDGVALRPHVLTHPHQQLRPSTLPKPTTRISGFVGGA